MSLGAGIFLVAVLASTPPEGELVLTRPDASLSKLLPVATWLSLLDRRLDPRQLGRELAPFGRPFDPRAWSESGVDVARPFVLRIGGPATALLELPLLDGARFSARLGEDAAAASRETPWSVSTSPSIARLQLGPSSRSGAVAKPWKRLRSPKLAPPRRDLGPADGWSRSTGLFELERLEALFWFSGGRVDVAAKARPQGPDRKTIEELGVGSARSRRILDLSKLSLAMELTAHLGRGAAAQTCEELDLPPELRPLFEGPVQAALTSHGSVLIATDAKNVKPTDDALRALSRAGLLPLSRGDVFVLFSGGTDAKSAEESALAAPLASQKRAPISLEVHPTRLTSALSGRAGAPGPFGVEPSQLAILLLTVADFFEATKRVELELQKHGADLVATGSAEL